MNRNEANLKTCINTKTKMQMCKNKECTEKPKRQIRHRGHVFSCLGSRGIDVGSRPMSVCLGKSHRPIAGSPLSFNRCSNPD